MIKCVDLVVETKGRGFYEITDLLNREIASELSSGLAHVFLRHTSASLNITENADPSVLADLETILARLAPDGDPAYRHTYEGEDDMAAHIRAVLTTNDLSVPIKNGRLALGTWQGVYLWEHRYRPLTRSIVLSINS